MYLEFWERAMTEDRTQKKNNCAKQNFLVLLRDLIYKQSQQIEICQIRYTNF